MGATYLLVHEQVLDSAHPWRMQHGGRPVLVQVSSGSKVAVSDELVICAQCTWTPAGVGLVTRGKKMLVDFPNAPRRARA